MKNQLFFLLSNVGMFCGSYFLSLGIRDLDINLQVIGAATLVLSLVTYFRSAGW